MQPLPKTLGKFVWHFYKKRPIAFLLIYLAPCLVLLEVTLIPYGLKLIVDIISQSHGSRALIFEQLQQPLLLIAFSWLTLLVGIRCQNWFQAYVIPKFQADVRLSSFDYVIGQSYQYFSDEMTGNLARKIGDLARSLESIRVIICWNVITAFSCAAVSLVLLSFVSPLFSMILGVWILFHLAITLTRSGAVFRVARQNAEDNSQLNGTIVDVLTNIIPLKLFASRQYEKNYVTDKQAAEVASNTRLFISMNIFRLFMDIPMTVMLASMIYYLISYWQQGLISTGDFVFVFNISFEVMSQMWHLGNMLAELFREIGISKQALSLTTVPYHLTDVSNAETLTVTKGSIHFENVSFTYNKGANVFKNKDVTIAPGEKVGLVGLSGSGKTSFVNLILRFYDVDSGAIRIDGQDISQVTQESLRSAISMIPQDTSLFHRSIKENIHYGNLRASDKQVMHAAKLANCDEFIQELEHGYDTLVGERGLKLSGGQRQRIAIARAILKDAPILILDEATASLDSITEAQIQASLEQHMQNRTTIVIAHRLSTLAKMDRILVLDQGQIVEDGSHQDLLAKQGHYAQLWQRQVGGFLPE